MKRKGTGFFLRDLSEKGISIRVQDGDLDIKAPKGQVTKEIIAELKVRKTEIMAYLSGVSAEKMVIIESVKNESDEYAISSAQRRLWVLSQLEEASVGHNMPNTILLEGEHDFEAFTKAIYVVIERHEILRTVFKSNDTGEIKQRVLPTEELGFTVGFRDCRSSENAAEDFIRTDAYRPFNLEKGPLIRATVIQVEDKEYIFYYNMHHIISDGWSGEVLAKDVFAYYNAFKEGLEVIHPTQIGLNDLKIQYRDYSVWQLEQLESDKYKGHRAYWLDKLKGELPLLRLPSNLSRPRIKTYNGEGLSMLMDTNLNASLKEFVDENGGSRFMVVLAALNVLFYRYTSETDIIIGTPVAGRDHPQLEDQIGFYINTLALRNELDPGESFKSFYDRLKSDTFNAYSHQAYPFDRLVEELEVKRDTSRNVVFDVSLTYHNVYQEKRIVDKGEQEVNKIVFTGSKKVKSDIEIHVQELGGHFSVDVFYNTDVYQRELITDFLQHFRQFLATIFKDPDDQIQRLNILTEKEKEEQLFSFNHSKISPIPTESLVSLFEKQARATPNNIAVKYRETVLNYVQLDEKSTQLAHCLLQDYKIVSGDIVGVQMEKSEWVIVALMGILKAGGVYLPIDPDYPTDRKKHICSDSAFNLLITEAGFIYDIDYYEGNVFAIDVEFEGEKYASESIADQVSGNDLAYIIYTSGSTGKPKGVLIEHKAIVNTILAQIERFETSTESKGLLFSSLSFDASISEIFCILLAGGSLSIINDEIKKNPLNLTEFIRKQEITIATLPPSYLAQIEIGQISGMEQLITAGEQANLEKALDFLETGTYFNAYGPTETAICATVFKLKDKGISGDRIPIGKPINNVKVYLLNEGLQLQPKGAIAEIYIGGPGLARGYLNNEPLTQEKFIRNPFSENEKIYRTGDLGRWLPDGNLEFVGRVDEQLKINGYRIEPGEIEHALSGHTAINSAVVIPAELDNGTVLVAYLVPTDNSSVELGEELNLNEIRLFLENRLPNYMIPTHFRIIESLPLTASGKIDKKALIKISGKSLLTGIEFVAPQSDREKLLVDVLTGVLQQDKIGINDNFYNLGGDSIKSIQVVGRLKQLGYFLKVEQILKTPVIKDLARLLIRTEQQSDQSEISGKIELTPIQNWFFSEKGIKNHEHFNQSVLLKSKSQIEEKVLESCLDELTKHHDALRIRVKGHGKDRELYNQSATVKSYELYTYDLSDTENDVAEIAAIGQSLQASFNLEMGPLFKAALFRLKDGNRLGLISHHLIVDGVSWRILLEDLLTLYSEISKGEKPQLPAKTTSFQSWSKALKAYAETEELQKESAYWKRLEEENIPEIPVVKQEMDLDSDPVMVSFNLGKANTKKLQTQVHHVYKTEINDILLTAFGLAIRTVFDRQKTVIKMEGHGREDIFKQCDLSRTVGWFTTAYPFVLNLPENLNRTEALVRVKDDLRKIPNKGIGYGVLCYLAKHKLAQTLVPQISFNFLGDFGKNAGERGSVMFEYATEKFGRELAEENKISLPLEVSGIVLDDNLNLSITYSPESIKSNTVQRLITEFETGLNSIVAELSICSETFLTVSDLTFKGLNSTELSELNVKGDVEDVYELSPLQKGIYFHWLAQESHSVYFEQTSYRVRSTMLNIDKLKKAYTLLIERHGVLRTCFSNDYADRPLQIVYKTAPVYFAYEKITKDTDVEEYLKVFKSNDMKQGFDLTKPSQMRLHIIELSDGVYEFIWSHHHILMDGWCVSVLINEFNALLKQEISGERANIPEVKGYAHYIEWLNKVDAKTSLNYWKNYLADYEQVAVLSYENKEVRVGKKQFSEVLEVKGELLRKIEQRCNELEVTINTFIQGVWGFLLSIYNNTNDAVFGTVVSGRPGELEGVENMIGLFINTIPVRTKYNETDTPSTFLNEIQQFAIQSMPHHYVSLSEIQAQSNVGMNLVDHIIIYQNYAIQKPHELSNETDLDFKVEAMEVVEQSNYDLNVVVGTAPDQLRVNLLFNGNRYSKEGMRRLVGHLNVLIERFVKDSKAPLSTFNCITEKEKEHLLIELNNTNVNAISEVTILDWFKKQTLKTPNNTAVVYENTRLTYDELDRKSNQLAHYLVNEHKVQVNDFIGLKLQRSEWVLIGILGIWKAGATYVPIDPEYPETRINYIEKDAGCKLSIDALMLDQFKSIIENYTGHPLDDTARPENPAYIIYTSGSTGNPKGVLITHANFNQFVHNVVQNYVPDNTIIQPFVASISFDISLFQLFFPLVTGGTSIVVGKRTFQNPEEFSVLLKEATVMDTVPAMYEALVDYLLKSEDELQLMPNIQRLFIGGDRIPNQLLNKLQTVFNNAEIVVTYGPTEATICSTGYFYEGSIDDEEPNGAIIGVPNDGTTIHIVNKNNVLKPKGVIGEICIGGTGVGKGYLNRPDLTAEKFIENPFIPKEKLYRTGDLGRWTEDNKIEFIGRADDQVKIRGYRIETGEIEYALEQLDVVEQAIVKAVNSQRHAEKELVAYLTTKDGKEEAMNPVDLKTRLREKLPDYMIPSHFMQLPRLPLTANGKIDRKGLPDPDGFGQERNIVYVAPENEIQERLVKIWGNILEQKEIGIHDDFFALGGHSLKALRLITAIQKEFDLKLDIQNLFQNTTVALLAAEIERISWLSGDEEKDQRNIDIIEI